MTKKEKAKLLKKLRKTFINIDEITCFTSDLIGLGKSSYFGVYSLKSKSRIISSDYNSIENIDGNLFLVRQYVSRPEKGRARDLYGVYSIELERLVIPVEYDYISKMNGDLFKIEECEKFGIFSINAKKLIVPTEWISLEVTPEISDKPGGGIALLVVGKKNVIVEITSTVLMI